MGGMHALEWPLCTPSDYVKNIIPIATSAYQGAWGISWSETQDRAIRADATFNNGWYHPIPACQPRSGLGVARMAAMLTYRSSQSFESRFGRRATSVAYRQTKSTAFPSPPLSETGIAATTAECLDETPDAVCFSAQTYLQYQADKFLDRFDANCYLHLMAKMNTHNVSRGRDCEDELDQVPTETTLQHIFSAIPKSALVIGVQSDLLFPLRQQIAIAQCLPGATFIALESNDGHDGFLLEFENLNQIISTHLRARCAWLYEGPILQIEEDQLYVVDSVFGEAESIVC
jgi:homoserine O-acetyltransferase/O-succinyltransferase